MSSNLTEANLKPGYIPALDGMRGLAICSVMVMHSGFPYFTGGFIGVDIFFVLSGFLITYLLIREYDRHQQTISFRDFYVRRALRLGPALVLLLVAVILWGLIFFDEEAARSNLVDAVIALFYMSNWARAFEIHPPHYLGHTWSLSIEEQFYILWPITLLLLLRLLKSRVGVLIGLVLAAISIAALRVVFALDGASINRLYNSLDTRADSLLVGCAVGVLIASNLINETWRLRLLAKLRFLPVIAVIAFLAIGLFCRWKDIQTYYWVLIAVELITALLILQIMLMPDGRVSRYFSMRPLVWLGTISYGLYLWHFPIFTAIGTHGYRAEIVLVAGSIITLGVATASYYFLERPVLRRKKRFTKNR